MSVWDYLWPVVVVVAICATLYGLHRWCLWLEARGLLYYKHKRPESSAAGCFVALQQAIDPGSVHVMQVMEEKRDHSDEEAPGEGLPSTRDPSWERES